MKRRIPSGLLAAYGHRRTWTALVCLIALMTSGCFSGANSVPDLEQLFAPARTTIGKRPIIFVPGLLGSKLVNEQTGEVVWPAFFRSSKDELDLPVGPDFLTHKDSLVATEAIDKAKIFKLWPKVNVFHKLFQALSKYGGYREGSWTEPRADGYQDTYYTFYYDWRRDQVQSARLLIQRIQELKQKLNRPDLRFNLITVSGGGTVSRYAAMYGDADLPLDDSAPEVTWAGAAHINKIFMFGPPNEGTADMLAVLLKGYSFSTGTHRPVKITKKLSREDALTSPAIFELLPHAGTVTFYDRDMKPLPVDIYDPAVWRRYGWSLAHESGYRDRYVQREARENGVTSKSDELQKLRALSELDGYLAAVLHRTRKYHQALNAQSPIKPPVNYYVFAGDCEETLQALVILQDPKSGRYETLTRPREVRGSDGRRFSRDEVKRLMFGPGDGRVTRRSLLAETFATERPADSPYKTTLPISHSFLICLVHGYIQDSPNVHNGALTFLVNDSVQ